MIKLCQQNDVVTIADEVSTGFGRTGRFFASDYLVSKPDIICMSKGLTGGVMALGATSTTDIIYNAFEIILFLFFEFKNIGILKAQIARKFKKTSLVNLFTLAVYNKISKLIAC